MLRLRHRALQGHLLRGGGNAGAPLEEDEETILESEYPHYKPYMTPEGIAAVERQGFMVVDEEGDYTTPLVAGAECAYAYTENGTTLCAIEKGVAGGPHDLPQADLVPPLSDPPHALLERDGRAQLPPLVGLRPARECGAKLGIRFTRSCANRSSAASARSSTARWRPPKSY